MFNIKSLIVGIFLSSFLVISTMGFSAMEEEMKSDSSKSNEKETQVDPAEKEKMAESPENDKKPIVVDINIIPAEEQEIATTDEGKTIRVALMGSKDIDVSKVDHHSVRLQGAKHNGNLVIVDKNNDGFNDFLVEFSADRLKLKEGANELTFNGMMSDGKPFKGTDTITIPAAK